LAPAHHAARSLTWPVLLAAPLLFVSRLNLLVRMELALDGDEAVVGLMSLHFLQGKGLPLFFYGQSYEGDGFVIVRGEDSDEVDAAIAEIISVIRVETA